MAFAPQNFKDLSPPAISAAWLNALDVTANSVLAGAQTVPQAQSALGIIPIVGGVGTIIPGGVDTGVVNAYVIPVPAGAMGIPTALAVGQTLVFVGANGNTGASTINVGGTGVQPI